MPPGKVPVIAKVVGSVSGDEATDSQKVIVVIDKVTGAS
jgi:hypothetical protein